MMNGDQLGFDALLQDADTDNATRVFDRETAHLPGTWAEALTCHRQQIADHHAAMLANEFETAMHIRQEAYLLASKLNGGRHGILAGKDAPGCKLDAAASAAKGELPLWGQSGSFVVDTAGLTARVEMGGMFGIGATAMTYLGFSVRAADSDQPFLSATGYRSFLGVSIPPEQGMTPEGFVQRVIEIHVEKELNDRLLRIDPDFFKR
ncbi:hypothetical protein [uncultured Roseobacter sp.]|uniref:hypothetical protein n=1 Tax=uncultured Roseobacter sp. TaxID=114847 RepID=UPI0026111AD0|nr:hypothetical protein [uncultured Roseobacter sp.]